MKTRNALLSLIVCLTHFPSSAKPIQDTRSTGPNKIPHTGTTGQSVTPQIQRVWDLADANFNAALTTRACSDPKVVQFLKTLNTRYKAVLAYGEGRMFDLRDFSLGALEPLEREKIFCTRNQPIHSEIRPTFKKGASISEEGKRVIYSIGAGGLAEIGMAVFPAPKLVWHAALISGIVGSSIGDSVVKIRSESRLKSWDDFENTRMDELQFFSSNFAYKLWRIECLENETARLEALQELYARMNATLRNARMSSAAHEYKILNEANTLQLTGEWALDLKSKARHQAILTGQQVEFNRVRQEKKWLEVLTRATLQLCSKEQVFAQNEIAIPMEAITDTSSPLLSDLPNTNSYQHEKNSEFELAR